MDNQVGEDLQPLLELESRDTSGYEKLAVNRGGVLMLASQAKEPGGAPRGEWGTEVKLVMCEMDDSHDMMLGIASASSAQMMQHSDRDACCERHSTPSPCHLHGPDCGRCRD